MNCHFPASQDEGQARPINKRQNRRDRFTLENNLHTRRPLKLVTVELKTWLEWIIRSENDLYDRQVVNQSKLATT